MIAEIINSAMRFRCTHMANQSASVHQYALTVRFKNVFVLDKQCNETKTVWPLCEMKGGRPKPMMNSGDGLRSSYCQ